MQSAIKRFLTATSHPLLKPGELVIKCEAGQPFTHCLYRDWNMCMNCEVEQLSGLLSNAQVKLLEAIDNPVDRINVFQKELRWEVHLKAGSYVHVSIPGKDVQQAKAVVHYSAENTNLFGVELLVRM